MKTAVEILLFAFGYPAAIIVIARFVPVVRERRTRWFLIHELGVAAIVAGLALRGYPRGVLVNGSWGVVAALWYVLAGRRARQPV